MDGRVGGSSFDCSVVLPVKNAGLVLADVLDGVAKQNFSGFVEVLLIDSGSTDGSLERLRLAAERPGWRLLEIAPESFGHAVTRNMGVTETSGEFIAFITHDAIPESSTWLEALVAPMLGHPDIAGVFGRHIAHRGASPYVGDELDRHFVGFRDEPTTWLTDRARYDTDERYRQHLHFFSSNNACIRRSVWEKIPFPDVAFAEDQAWAKAVTEAGWKRAYADDAVVSHSHDFGPIETLRRAFDESRSFRRHFGYRLAPTLLGIARTTVGFTLRDARAARAHGYWRKAPWATAMRPLLHLAKASGHFLGSHEQRLPPAFSDRLSLDRRLQVGLR